MRIWKLRLYLKDKRMVLYGVKNEMMGEGRGRIMEGKRM